MTLSEIEMELGRLAWRTVLDNGGFLDFDSYDAAMQDILYFSPISWCAGWGNHGLLKANNDKLCAFAAVHMGLLHQRSDGYVVT